MNKIISDIDFENALKNRDNKLIMEKACSSFRKSIDYDELHRCKLIALWEAMKTWNPQKRKFTSFLYQKVVWECLKTVKKQRKNRYVGMKFDPPTYNQSNFMEYIEELPEDLKEIIVKRYLCSMTLREISEKHGFCKETIRRRILTAIEIIKNNSVLQENGV